MLPLLLFGHSVSAAAPAAAADAGPTYQVHESTCFSNAPNVIDTVTVTEAEACCTICQRNFQCKSNYRVLVAAAPFQVARQAY